LVNLNEWKTSWKITVGWDGYGKTYFAEKMESLRGINLDQNIGLLLGVLRTFGLHGI
jgi:hypothetical protein